MSASSPSDTDSQHSTVCALRTRRHRDRVSQGLSVRQYASPAERAALLAAPYSQLDRNQRRRVRRYQQQQVTSTPVISDVQQLQQLIIKLKSIKPKTRIKHDPSISHTLCPKCLYRQDWLRINNQCIHCYFRRPKIINLLK